MFSAHWQGARDEIYVNKDEHADLIYEFVQPPNMNLACVGFA